MSRLSSPYVRQFLCRYLMISPKGACHCGQVCVCPLQQPPRDSLNLFEMSTRIIVKPRLTDDRNRVGVFYAIRAFPHRLSSLDILTYVPW